MNHAEATDAARAAYFTAKAEVERLAKTQATLSHGEALLLTTSASALSSSDHAKRVKLEDRLFDAAKTPITEVPDGEALRKLVGAADELSLAARLLRHYLPERADEGLLVAKARIKENPWGNSPARYGIVWPDGELKGNPFIQRPAAERAWATATRHRGVRGLRMWDAREQRFIHDEGTEGP